MYTLPPDFQQPDKAICSCDICAGWDAPRRKPQLGKYGWPVAYRGRWYGRWEIGYYSNSHTDFLHRVIWTDHVGPIPRGWHIHHVDEDRGNNQISNLRLLTPKAHSAEHPEPKGYTAFNYETRGSNTRRAWEYREWKPFVCAHCGKSGTTPYVGHRKFCNYLCEQRYKSALKVMERICIQCGQVYIARDPRRMYCSPACNGVAYYTRKRLQHQGRG